MLYFVFMFSSPDSKFNSNEASLDDPGTQRPSPWVCTVRLLLRVETLRAWAESGNCFPSSLRHKPGDMLVDSLRPLWKFSPQMVPKCCSENVTFQN